MKRWILIPLVLLCTSGLQAGETDSLRHKQQVHTQTADSDNNDLQFQTGEVALSNGVARLNIPPGFKFLDAEQSRYVLTTLWGNPPDASVLGVIFPLHANPYSDSGYSFVVSYDAIGHVKDSDANRIDYDELLKDIQDDEEEENTQRMRMGYPTVEMIGWAQKPFYDPAQKVLHWAKELRFSGKNSHTLNYEVRILGRHGILSLNAVAGMHQLPAVKRDVDQVLGIAEFTEGHRYADFDASVDKPGNWTIGHLIAGKAVTDTAFVTFIAKFGQFILIGIAVLGALSFKFIVCRKICDNQTFSTPASEL